MVRLTSSGVPNRRVERFDNGWTHTGTTDPPPECFKEGTYISSFTLHLLHIDVDTRPSVFVVHDKRSNLYHDEPVGNCS